MTIELTPDDEEVLVDLLLEWEEAQDSPMPKSAEDLCGPRRDLVDELNRRIDELSSINRLMIDFTAKTRLMELAEYDSIEAPHCPTIAGFRVLGEIGRGGMGIVYKAIQLNLKRPVALKLINDMSQNPKMLISRLRDEAEALGKLNHEHVIRVYDVVDRDGMVCLVLEYVDGLNLAQRDSGSSIDPTSAARTALTVATTMSDVHRAGLLHRDIKPGNLLRDSRGRIKISDFGLAKHLAPNSMMSVTTEGIGSPSYMAPEQAIGIAPNIGEWTDVYGIGATLYDLITGRPPFLGATHLATLDQVRHNDPVSPRLLVPEIPKDLETICLKCLSKEPRQRYASAAALASDLEAFLEGRPISARPLGLFGQTWRWTKRNPDRAGLIAAIALGFVMAVGLGAWEITRINNATSHARTQEFYLKLSQISDRSLRTPTAWSWKNLDELKHAVPLRPKEDTAALSRLRSETTKALAAFDTRKQRELLHGFDPYAIEFNPDGSVLAVGANAGANGIVKVALIDTTTWETSHTLTFPADARWIRDKPDGIRSMVFSPDGKELYVGTRSGWIYGKPKGTHHNVLTLDFQAGRLWFLLTGSWGLLAYCGRCFMARLARAEVFSPDEVAIVHVMNRVVRRCFLLGDDPLTGKNYDHRKLWVETLLKRFAACFGIDLLGFAILSNHFHLILRSRPDVVQTWDDTEVARRWLLLCPIRKDAAGQAEEPNEMELNTIRNDRQKLETIRLRLSDIAWWMRLLCQNVATRANSEDGEVGRFWQNRFRAVRLLDEAAILACAAYVDLNPIRAAMAQTLEQSDHTSAQRRIESLDTPVATATPAEAPASTMDQPAVDSTALTTSPAASATTSSASTERPDRFLSPISLEGPTTKTGPNPSQSGFRCSDKGFLPISLPDYLSLLDWTARQLHGNKRGRTPQGVKPILERLGLEASAWSKLVGQFGRLFINVAGKPQTISATRSRIGQHRYHLRKEARELLTAD